MKLKKVFGQPSWRLASHEIEAYVTQLGGHLGPVTFDRQDRQIQPYSVAPWAEETFNPPLPPVLRALRGDFFCLPFGGNETPHRGEQHPAHGETANSTWHFESLQNGCLHLSLKTTVRAGRVDKRIAVRDGHNAVYCQHMISGMRGPMNFGHHATLKFQSPGIIATSCFTHGQVFPGVFERPENKGYSALKPRAQFKSLTRVPMLTGEFADLSQYPARRGYEDLVMITGDSKLPLGWTTVTFPQQRYLWFGLKDPRMLSSTVFWISNGGRHYPPWNGRHVDVMGLEEVTSFFHLGLAESVRAKTAYPTCRQLDGNPLAVNYIMGVTKIPPGFDRVATVEAEGESVVFRSANGRSARATVDISFLTGQSALTA